MTPVEGIVLLAAGVLLGASALSGGLYSIGVWGPATVGVMAASLAALVTRPRRLRSLEWVILAGLSGMAGLSAVSTGWAESSPQALLEAHRWALCAGVFLVVLLLARSPSARRLLLGAVAAGVLVVCAVVLVRMLTGDGADLFVAFRLAEPLGYVNGQAGLFLLAFWPLVAVAERASSLVLRATATGLAAVVVSLTYLTQSRGAFLALVGSVLVLLAIMPGRSRRAWVVGSVAVAVAALSSPLGEVYDQAAPGRLAPGDQVLREAALAAVWAGVVAAAVSAIPDLVDRLAAWRQPSVAAVLRLWMPRLMGLLAVIAIAAAAVSAPALTDEAREQVRKFKDLETDRPEGSRLLTGGGNRYDYWRVAVEEFRERSGAGYGAGNYDARYFLLRRTSEDVRQPHSLVLQTLAELGLVGAAVLALWLAAAIAALVLAARRRGPGAGELGVAVGAGGLFVTWLLQTIVDWLHLLPGITVAAIAALALLSSTGSLDAGEGVRRRLIPVLGLAAGVLVVSVGVARLTLAAHYRDEASSVVAEDPGRALELTEDSLTLQGQSLPTLFVRAGAFARLNRPADARTVLEHAAQLEPHDFVSHALLGDLAARTGDLRRARRDYRRALMLNPRSPTLRRLAKDPAASRPPAPRRGR